MADIDYTYEDENNTTTELLGSGETYTGDWTRNDEPDVAVSCHSSSSGTLYFEFSNDGENVNTFPPVGFAVVAGIHKFRVSTSKTGGGGNPKVRFKAYVYLRSLGITVIAFDETVDTQSGTTIDINESSLLLVAGSVAWVTMDTDTNNTDGSGRFTLRTYLDK